MSRPIYTQECMWAVHCHHSSAALEASHHAHQQAAAILKLARTERLPLVVFMNDVSTVVATHSFSSLNSQIEFKPCKAFFQLQSIDK